MAKKKDSNKSLGGRPTMFKEEYVDLAFNYCLLGATDNDLANFFDVTETTINNWKLEYPEFFESIKKGKEQADGEIALSLYKRAKGAVIKTQQAIKVKSITIKDGKRVETEGIEVVDLQQEQAPDTTAAIFWLKNRRPSYWRDKIEQEVTTRPVITFETDDPETIEEINRI